MNERKRNWITWAVVGTTFLIVALMLLGTLQRPARIQLPATNPFSGPSSGETENSGALTVISVTPQTVQAAIGSLERPETYSRTVTVEQIWSGGSGTSETAVHVKGGWSRTDRTMPDGRVRHTLTNDETVYIWTNADAELFTAPAGEITADNEQAIPTYEDILELPMEAITVADYRMISGVNCIYVETAPDEGGYTLRYWVDVQTGLLAVSEKLLGEDTVYRMAALTLAESAPADELFVLPDGTDLLAKE